MKDNNPHASDLSQRRFYRTLFHENRDLLRAILRFNTAWREQARETWFETEGIDPEIRGRIRNSPFLTGQDLGSGPSGFWEFEEDDRRIMLVEPDLLKTAADYWGAAFYAPIICRSVLSRERAALEQQLGKPLMAYAMGRGRFYLGRARDLVLPEAPPGESAAEAVRGCGVKALLLLSRAWPGPLRQKADEAAGQLLRDGNSGPMHPEQAISVYQQRLLWGVLKNIFLREVAPQWRPCFS